MDKIKIKKNSRILFLGDSITDSQFNYKKRFSIRGKDTYAIQLEKRLKEYSADIHVDIRGIASNRTYHLCDRLTKDCIELRPDVVIMLIGVNDAWEHYVPENYPPNPRPTEPHIREIYRRISEELPGTQVLYLMPFMVDAVKQKLPFHKKLDEYREMLRSIAEENGAAVLDLQQVIYEAQKSIKPKKLARDGIHPTNLGHRVIADAVWEYFKF